MKPIKEYYERLRELDVAEITEELEKFVKQRKSEIVNTDSTTSKDQPISEILLKYELQALDNVANAAKSESELYTLVETICLDRINDPAIGTCISLHFRIGDRSFNSIGEVNPDFPLHKIYQSINKPNFTEGFTFQELEQEIESFLERMMACERYLKENKYLPFKRVDSRQ